MNKERKALEEAKVHLLGACKCLTSTECSNEVEAIVTRAPSESDSEERPREEWKRGMEDAAKVVEGGSFLHNESPPARFAREAAAAIRRKKDAAPPSESSPTPADLQQWHTGVAPLTVPESSPTPGRPVCGVPSVFTGRGLCARPAGHQGPHFHPLPSPTSEAPRLTPIPGMESEESAFYEVTVAPPPSPSQPGPERCPKHGFILVRDHIGGKPPYCCGCFDEKHFPAQPGPETCAEMDRDPSGYLIRCDSSLPCPEHQSSQPVSEDEGRGLVPPEDMVCGATYLLAEGMKVSCELRRGHECRHEAPVSGTTAMGLTRFYWPTEGRGGDKP